MLVYAAVAWPLPAGAQHGVAFPIVADSSVGPYVVSVWTAADVGMGMVYVTYRGGNKGSFVRPTSVRIGVAPLSGRLTEVLYDAQPESVRQGARYVAHVSFDRSEDWRVRVITESPAGNAELSSRVKVLPAGLFGPIVVVLYSLPFIVVAAVLWRARLVRRRASGRIAALVAH